MEGGKKKMEDESMEKSVLESEDSMMFQNGEKKNPPSQLANL